MSTTFYLLPTSASSVIQSVHKDHQVNGIDLAVQRSMDIEPVANVLNDAV